MNPTRLTRGFSADGERRLQPAASVDRRRQEDAGKTKLGGLGVRHLDDALRSERGLIDRYEGNGAVEPHFAPAIGDLEDWRVAMADQVDADAVDDQRVIDLQQVMPQRRARLGPVGQPAS